MARRSPQRDNGEQTQSSGSGNLTLEESVARLTQATELLLKVAERLDQKVDAVFSGPDAPPPDQAKPKRPRRKQTQDEQPSVVPTPRANDPLGAAIGGMMEAGGESGMRRVEMNAPSDEVFARFFAKVLGLYDLNTKRQAEERDKRFRSENREEALKEMQDTIETVFFSPLITNAEKNAALHIIIKQIVPYDDRIEITYL